MAVEGRLPSAWQRGVVVTEAAWPAHLGCSPTGPSQSAGLCNLCSDGGSSGRGGGRAPAVPTVLRPPRSDAAATPLLKFHLLLCPAAASAVTGACDLGGRALRSEASSQTLSGRDDWGQVGRLDGSLARCFWRRPCSRPAGCHLVPGGGPFPEELPLTG